MPEDPRPSTEWAPPGPHRSAPAPGAAPSPVPPPPAPAAGSFAPPTAPAAAPPPAPAFAAPPAPAFAAPRLPAAEPRRLSRTARIWIAVGALGGALLLAGAITVIVLGVGRLAQQTGETLSGGEPLLTGPPAVPGAEAPLECPEGCFRMSALGQLAPESDEMRALGFTFPSEVWGTYRPMEAEQVVDEVAAGWDAGGGAPDVCSFLYGLIPTTDVTGPDRITDGRAQYIVTWGTDADPSKLELAARMFSDSATASTHLTTLHAELADCTHYGAGEGLSRWEVDVTAAPAIELPDEVAAVGWVESAVGHRIYVFDVQRGNLVVRASLWSYEDVTEQEFRALVETMADRLAALEVNPPAP